MSSFQRITVSPYCRHLASKKLVFQTRPPVSDEEILDASGHTWCQESQEVIGPDGDTCSTMDCHADRSCFQAYGQ